MRTRAQRAAAPLQAPRRVAMAAQNALEIMRAGRLSAARGAPYDIVYEGEHYRLRRYRGAAAGGDGAAGPILLVPPLMVASEVYDISPDTSVVRALTREGVDVWLVDFGAPEHEEGGLDRTLDDHVRAVSDAADRIAAETGKAVHLSGYSQGGLFVYQAAALRRSAGIASLITFGSPVDIHRSVPTLGDRLTEPLIGALRALLSLPLERAHSLPGKITSTGFKILSADKELAQLVEFVRDLHDRKALERREQKRLFLGGQGFVAWPGPALRKFLDEVVVRNRMSTGGFVIDGRAASLADIDVPILYFVGTRDEMARPAAVRGIRRAAPRAESYEVTVAAGHFGLVVGRAAQSETWPAVAAWMRWQEGRGEKPAPLCAAERPPEEAPSGGEIAESALEELQFDVALAADVAAKAAQASAAWLADQAQSAADALTQLRWQVPRLHRLRRIRPDTPLSMADELSRQAARIGDRTFFMWRGRAFSYRVADRRVDRVTRGLLACGVRPGDRVALLMGTRPSFLSALYALNRLGAVAVLLSPEASDTALRRGFEKSGAQRVISDPERAERAAKILPGSPLVLGGGPDREVPAGTTDMEAIDPEAVRTPAWYARSPGRARDLALILVSAGRTGEPRAAFVSNHRWALSALGAAAACTLGPRDTVYCALPLHHASGGMVATGSALVGGARLALAEAFSPAEFWTEARRYGATVAFYAGEMCRDLVLEPPRRGEASHPIRLFSGSGMRADVWKKLEDRFGPVGILEFYAATEANAVLANASGEKPGAVGRPLPGSRELAVAAYDPDFGDFLRDARGRGTRAAPGRTGMLLVRAGPEEADSAAEGAPVLRDFFARGDAWLGTGDLMRRDGGGDHWYEGRVADVIPSPSGAVLPRKVEDRLYRMPGVTRAVVYGREDGGAARVEAAVALAPGYDLAPRAADRALAGLPERARPEVIRQVDEIPMTEGFRPLRLPVADAARAGALAPRATLVKAEAEGTYEAETERETA